MSIIKYILVVAFAQLVEPYGTEITIIIAAFLLGLIIKHMLNLRKERKERMRQEKMEMNEREEKEKIEKSAPDTIGLMFSVLCNIGCQPKKEENGTLSVSYQGENFSMEFGGRYVRIWDPAWSMVGADDPDLSIIREAINEANFNSLPTVVYTDPNDDGFIYTHSRYDIMLHPDFSDNELYVKAVLDSFFDAKRNVSRNFQRMKAAQQGVQNWLVK